MVVIMFEHRGLMTIAGKRWADFWFPENGPNSFCYKRFEFETMGL